MNTSQTFRLPFKIAIAPDTIAKIVCLGFPAIVFPKRPHLVQCWCWEELCSPYGDAKPHAEYPIRRDLSPVLGLGSGGRTGPMLLISAVRLYKRTVCLI